MENTARVSEELYQVPFPKSDIILLVVDPDSTEHTIGQGHLGSHMVLERFLEEVGFLSHETAHYYARNGPGWFTEGGAEFIAAYVNHHEGVRSLSEHKIDTTQRLRDTCEYQGIANIAHLQYRNEHIFTGPGKGGCTYIMGEHLLLNIYETIGEPAMSHALEELYLTGVESRGLSEEIIYEAFWNHAPSGSKNAFDELYRQLHGGNYENPENEFGDDHSDEPNSASRVSVGESTTGTMDYLFDFDFFEFEANQGDNYRILVEHPSLQPAHIMLFAPDGESPEIWNWKSLEQTPTGLEILWTAPTSGNHYFAVQNFAGHTGTYTLKINSTPAVVDDHGGSPDTATTITLDVTLEGGIDNAFDDDYFRFRAEEGKQYILNLQGDTLDSPNVRLSERSATLHWETRSLGNRGIRAHLLMQESGDVYFFVKHATSGEGTYSLTVTEGGDDSGDNG